MTEPKRIRVLMCKLGLDGHERGAKIITTCLRDAGMEVIYTGLFQTPEMVVRTAIQEDVDVLGMSYLSGEHLYYTSKVIDLLKEEGIINNVLLLVGGAVPKQDIPALNQLGVGSVFVGDTPVSQIIDYIEQNVQRQEVS